MTQQPKEKVCKRGTWESPPARKDWRMRGPFEAVEQKKWRRAFDFRYKYMGREKKIRTRVHGHEAVRLIKKVTPTLEEERRGEGPRRGGNKGGGWGGVRPTITWHSRIQLLGAIVEGEGKEREKQTSD